MGKGFHDGNQNAREVTCATPPHTLRATTGVHTHGQPFESTTSIRTVVV